MQPIKPPYLAEAEAVCKRRTSSKYPDAEQRLLTLITMAYREASYELPLVETIAQVGHCIRASTAIVYVKELSLSNLLDGTAGVQTVKKKLDSMPRDLKRYVCFKAAGTADKWSVAVDIRPERVDNFICTAGMYIVRLKDMPYC